MPNIQEDRFYPIANVFYWCAINQPWSHLMKRDLSCFDPNSNIDDSCLNCSSSLFFLRVVLFWLFGVQGLLYDAKASAMCSIKDVITYALRKAIKLQRCSPTRGRVFVCASIEWLGQKFDISNCPLCFRFTTVWGKRWNFTHLFHCSTTSSTSLSLRSSSFDLTFTGSWQLKAQWPCTRW